MAKRIIRHKLTEKNLDAMTANCAHCGNSVPLKAKTLRGKTRYVCRKAERYWSYSVRRGLNVTPEQFDRMLEAQGGLCAICLQTEGMGKLLAVDHNHVTGKLRGLLCGRCNTAIGLLKESLENLARATEYLKAA